MLIRLHRRFFISDANVIVCDDDGIISSIKDRLTVIESMMVEDYQDPVLYLITAKPRIASVLKYTKEDGHYRQFEKRDKRRNFRYKG